MHELGASRISDRTAITAAGVLSILILTILYYTAPYYTMPYMPHALLLYDIIPCISHTTPHRTIPHTPSHHGTAIRTVRAAEPA